MDIKNNNLHSPEVNARITESAKLEVEIKPDMEKLRAYTKTKLALASQLRIVSEALTELGMENVAQQFGRLMVKLAEDRFTLAVLGQFKRGKSSLMNAIIGRELLPTGVLPLTSAITVLKYGPTERLIVSRQNSIFPGELSVSSLSDYVTEKGNPGNQKKVKTACVELPVPFLRHGIEFVDTPGIGSTIMANTATTYSFLPECDAVLFVTSVDTPMTSLELEFLKEIRKYVSRIFFVVNKIDLVTNDERAEVIKFVSETIGAHIESGTVKVFPVSARLGLTARTSGDVLLYEQSGLKAIEETLASFLSAEKSAVFLAAVAHKAILTLDGEAAKDAFGEVALQARTKVLQEEKPVTFHRDPHAAALAITGARPKLETLYKSILDGRMAEMEDTDLPLSIALETGSGIETPIEASTSEAVDIVSDLQTRECPVCRHLTKQVSDFFAHWQYQIGTEEQSQIKFAAELGFCPVHTWQLLDMSSQHGASVGFARLTGHISHLLRDYNSMSSEGVRRLVHDSRNCRVCNLLREAEEEYIRKLARFIDEIAGRNQYRRSQGACLYHLGLLVDAVSSAESREFIVSHAAQRFAEDAEDMQSYALKRDALRRGLQNRNEEDAYLRAIIRMVGSRGMQLPRRKDSEI